jgi:hypothetical protein
MRSLDRYKVVAVYFNQRSPSGIKFAGYRVKFAGQLKCSTKEKKRRPAQNGKRKSETPSITHSTQINTQHYSAYHGGKRRPMSD